MPSSLCQQIREGTLGVAVKMAQAPRWDREPRQLWSHCLGSVGAFSGQYVDVELK